MCLYLMIFFYHVILRFLASYYKSFSFKLMLDVVMKMLFH